MGEKGKEVDRSCTHPRASHTSLLTSSSGTAERTICRSTSLEMGSSPSPDQGGAPNCVSSMGSAASSAAAAGAALAAPPLSSPSFSAARISTSARLEEVLLLLHDGCDTAATAAIRRGATMSREAAATGADAAAVADAARAITDGCVVL